MKVAVTSEGNDMSSAFSQRFGRAKWFIIVDDETGSFKAIQNEQNLDAPQGAGIQSAALVAREGVKCVITGHCGPKAFATLKSQGIEVLVGKGSTVKEVLDSLKSGELEPFQSADVESHWV